MRERTLKRMKILLGEGLITSRRSDPYAAAADCGAGVSSAADCGVCGADCDECARESAERGWTGVELDVADEMMQLSLHIVARTLFDY
jgi:hypothetical protein